MNLVGRARSLFAVGECTTPIGRSLVSEQFRILTNQIPILYAVLLVDSTSVALVLPDTVNGWLRFGVPGVLLTVSVLRMIQWIRLRGVEFSPEQSFRFLSLMRIPTGALNFGFLFWILALFETVDPALRAPVTLLVFMGCIGSAYCLGSFPGASRLTLLIAGLPIALRLLVTGEPLLVCIGVNLGFLLALPQSSHEQQLPGDRWVRIEERRTSDGGSIGIRVDITDLKRSEASFRLLFEENPLPMWVADADTRRLLAVNAAMCSHYGYRREEMLSMSEHHPTKHGGHAAEPTPRPHQPGHHQTTPGDTY